MISNWHYKFYSDNKVAKFSSDVTDRQDSKSK